MLVVSSNQRREYTVIVALNDRQFSRLVIDPHYEEKHPDMSDEIIIQLVRAIHGTDIEPDAAVDEDGFQYFATEVTVNKKTYRIILTYCDEDFLGVINAFRVKGSVL